jgi:hypothetical protein
MAILPRACRCDNVLPCKVFEKREKIKRKIK